MFLREVLQKESFDLRKSRLFRPAGLHPESMRWGDAEKKAGRRKGGRAGMESSKNVRKKK